MVPAYLPLAQRLAPLDPALTPAGSLTNLFVIRIQPPKSKKGESAGSPFTSLFHFTTVSFTALFNVPEDVVTVTYPVVAPVGIVAVR